MTGRYQAYSEYKDSGIEWIGEIPKEWTLIRLKYMAHIKNGQDYKTVEDDNGYPVIGSGGQFAFASTFLYDKESDLLGRKGTIDKPLYVDKPFWVVDTMYYTEIIDEVPPKFLYYLALTIQFNRHSTNTALPSMTQENLGSFIFAVPPSKNDKALIAAFLDHETAKIDNLIQKQLKLIALLKEKRQAVISHAVTKGLKPDAPMKDSGVEWLGEVPAHWEIVPLKYLCTFRGGGTPSKDNPLYWENGNIPWVSPKDMKKFWLSETKDKLTSMGVNESSTNYIEAGSLLMVVRSGILQRTIPISINTVRLTLNQDMKALNFGSRMKTEYVSFIIQGNVNALLLEWHKEGATVESIEHEYLSNSYFPVPPIKEQEKIITKLNKELRLVDGLEIKVSKALKLLKERRTAIISAAVTGKIDVRNWQPPPSHRETQ